MKQHTFSRIETVSKKDRVVATLREAIVSGRMKPGDAVVEGKVARQLGVGQPVIREALLDLEHQGFVQRVPYRGTSVTKLGADEIEQIQQLRVELVPVGPHEDGPHRGLARITAAIVVLFVGHGPGNLVPGA